jgi:hypothetical protein
MLLIQGGKCLCIVDKEVDSIASGEWQYFAVRVQKITKGYNRASSHDKMTPEPWKVGWLVALAFIAGNTTDSDRLPGVCARAAIQGRQEGFKVVLVAWM